MTNTITELSELSLPDKMLMGVMFERCESDSPWLEYRWDVAGVVSVAPETEDGFRMITDSGDRQQYLYTSLVVLLHKDECESYYHNMKSPQPGCFVVARRSSDDENEAPEPFLITLSFDAAHSYQEGDDLVYAVPIPPELYQWSEAYVIEHYAPEKRKKRKRTDWKQGQKPESGLPLDTSKAGG